MRRSSQGKDRAKAISCCKASRWIDCAIASPLLGGLDRFRRDIDRSGTMAGMDAFERQAFGVLTSSKLVDALDLSKEIHAWSNAMAKAMRSRSTMVRCG